MAVGSGDGAECPSTKMQAGNDIKRIDEGLEAGEVASKKTA
jgi:hypothetical protein